jgi:hypothetical protein
MARYKDLPKTHLGITDGYMLEHSVKGSAEPAITERREEDKYTKVIEEIRWELQEIKKDIQSLKDFVETMDKNGLKMKRQW